MSNTNPNPSLAVFQVAMEVLGDPTAASVAMADLLIYAPHPKLDPLQALNQPPELAALALRNILAAYFQLWKESHVQKPNAEGS